MTFIIELELENEKIHPQEIKLFRHIFYQINKIKSLESDKHNQPMFSVAAKKLTEKLKELLEKNKDVDKKEEEQERTPSNLDSSLSSINASICTSNFLIKGQGSLNSLIHNPQILAQGQPIKYVRGSSQQKSVESQKIERKLNPIPENPIHEFKTESRKKNQDNLTMINANNLIINITQHTRSKSNGKSVENFK